MKPIIKIIAWLAIPLLIAIIAWETVPSRGVPVLTYHQIGDSPDWYYVSAVDFERQIAYLRQKGYHTIHVRELIAGLNGQNQLPAKPIVITFDDGYKNNWTHAVPILEKHQSRATFFVVTGRMGHPDYMSWQELRTMQQKGMEIGSHTFNHYTLNEINLKEFSRELRLSRLMLENNLQPPTDIFANPFGETTPAVVTLLKESGYSAACSSIVGTNFAGTDPYQIKRVTIKNMPWGLGLTAFRLRLLWLDLIGKMPFLQQTSTPA